MTDKTALTAELKTLNDEVKAILAKRKAWMDAHMADFARYQIGEEIYDANTGRRLGVISKHYRYWGDRDPTYDTSMNVEYEFHTGNNCYDNTSRQPGLSICNLDELAARRKREADYLILKAKEWRKGF